MPADEAAAQCGWGKTAMNGLRPPAAIRVGAAEPEPLVNIDPIRVAACGDFTRGRESGADLPA